MTFTRGTITLPIVSCCDQKIAPQINPVREKVRWDCTACVRTVQVRLSSVPLVVDYLRRHPELAPINPAVLPQIIGLVRGKRVSQPSVDYDSRLPAHLRDGA